MGGTVQCGTLSVSMAGCPPCEEPSAAQGLHLGGLRWPWMCYACVYICAMHVACVHVLCAHTCMCWVYMHTCTHVLCTHACIYGLCMHALCIYYVCIMHLLCTHYTFTHACTSLLCVHVLCVHMCMYVCVCGHTGKYMEPICKICIHLLQSSLWVHSGLDGDLATPSALSSSCPVGSLALQWSLGWRTCRRVQGERSLHSRACSLSRLPFSIGPSDFCFGKVGVQGTLPGGVPQFSMGWVAVQRAHPSPVQCKVQGKFATKGEVNGPVGERLDRPRSHCPRRTAVGAGRPSRTWLTHSSSHFPVLNWVTIQN